jgi:membrane dipeptidase
MLERLRLSKQVGRIDSLTIDLNPDEEERLQEIMNKVIMMDLHEHPIVMTEDMTRLQEYLSVGEYTWGYEAAKAGGWSTVCTANGFRGNITKRHPSAGDFQLMLEEIGLMFTDIKKNHDNVLVVQTPEQIREAKSLNKLGFFPTVEHLAIGNQLFLVDVLYAMGIRMAGLTYSFRTYIGDGCYERTDTGLSEFGIEVIERMNQLGMIIDLAHASHQTKIDAVQHSEKPVIFSHNFAHTLTPVSRSTKDDALLACANKGGLICITAVPNQICEGTEQTIECVLDHYDYMVNLVGIDHVGIGTDTLIGDHVAFASLNMTGPASPDVPYMDGLESPADGKNIIRGLIKRGYNDEEIYKIAGNNALVFMKDVL